jgi:hypothetical protein
MLAILVFAMATIATVVLLGLAVARRGVTQLNIFAQPMEAGRVGLYV